jgi:hypothetical protein
MLERALVVMAALVADLVLVAAAVADSIRPATA